MTYIVLLLVLLVSVIRFSFFVAIFGGDITLQK